MPRNPLNPRLPPKNKKTGRRNVKRSKKPGTHTAQSEALRRLWQTPEFRERMRQRDIARAEDRKKHPIKYSRIGIPDGYTREQVRPLWERAYALADKFIALLKEHGKL